MLQHIIPRYVLFLSPPRGTNNVPRYEIGRKLDTKLTLWKVQDKMKKNDKTSKEGIFALWS